MRRLLLLSAMVCAVALPAAAARHHRAAPRKPPLPPGKPVARIDSLIATEKGRRVLIEAKGAADGGGWTGARLQPVKSAPRDPHTVVVDFVADPPPPDKAVIAGLVPVSASTRLRIRRGVIAVRAVAGSNEITTQILK